MTPFLLELEQMVVDAWPAPHVEELDGWLLRSSGGPTHRGNSTATLAAHGALTLTERLELTERWYRERGQPAMFQIGPCAQPPELDEVLAARGYVKAGGAVCAVAKTQVVAERTHSAVKSRVEREPGVDWLGIAEGSSRHASTKHIFRGFLERLGNRCRYATGWAAPDQPAAIGLGVLSPPWLGIYAMHTRPDLRRCGAARAVLHALAQSALADGVSDLYLLVEPTNTPARALYATAGFEDVYGYHYRIPGAG
jgi:ribosomal protein S18 acetylase RimI-like enzyme